MKNKKIAVIGLGYVGLPLAVEFSKKYSTLGFDIKKSRVNELNHGSDSTLEVDDKFLKSALDNGLSLSNNIESILTTNIYYNRTYSY